MTYDAPSGVIKFAAPAAGADISFSTDYDYRIHLIKIPLTTDGVAGDRDLLIRITVDSEVIYETELLSAITANSSQIILMGSGFPLQVDGDHQIVPLPVAFRLPRGATIETVTTGLDVGDQFGEVVMFVDAL